MAIISSFSLATEGILTGKITNHKIRFFYATANRRLPSPITCSSSGGPKSPEMRPKFSSTSRQTHFHHRQTEPCRKQLHLQRLVCFAHGVSIQNTVNLLHQWDQSRKTDAWREFCHFSCEVFGKGIPHYIASHVKCHLSEWGSYWIETSILEVRVKLVSPCLIKSVVESSLVNPTEINYGNSATLQVEANPHVSSPGVPLTIQSLR